jgi:hypothetical protein
MVSNAGNGSSYDHATASSTTDATRTVQQRAARACHFHVSHPDDDLGAGSTTNAGRARP